MESMGEIVAKAVALRDQLEIDLRTRVLPPRAVVELQDMKEVIETIINRYGGERRQIKRP